MKHRLTIRQRLVTSLRNRYANLRPEIAKDLAEGDATILMKKVRELRAQGFKVTFPS